MQQPKTSKGMTRKERDERIEAYNSLAAEQKEAVREKTLDADDLRALIKRKYAALDAYYEGLPRMVLSRCPHTHAPLVRSFDPWGVEGFWWQENEGSENHVEPEAPETHVLLCGALALNGVPPKGGLFEDACVGPGAPFVVPAVLELPTMIAVVSSLRLECGYTAYPVAYFATEPPPPGSLTHEWRRTSYEWIDETGDYAWGESTLPWEFDLAPWIDRGKVAWIEPGDAAFNVRTGSAGDCPFVGLPGVREMQILRGDALRTEPAPSGAEPGDVFSD